MAYGWLYEPYQATPLQFGCDGVVHHYIGVVDTRLAVSWREATVWLGALITNVLKTSGTTAGLVLLPTAEAAADAGCSGDTVENERNARGAKRENQYC